MLEQQLINSFMKFSAKAGAGDFIRELIQRIEDNGNPKSWTPAEMQRAIEYLEDQVNIFSREDALKVINTLARKYNITSIDITPEGQLHDPEDLPGVQGLQ
jgi:hypothetical protein